MTREGVGLEDGILTDEWKVYSESFRIRLPLNAMGETSESLQ